MLHIKNHSVQFKDSAMKFRSFFLYLMLFSAWPLSQSRQPWEIQRWSWMFPLLALLCALQCCTKQWSPPPDCLVVNLSQLCSITEVTVPLPRKELLMCVCVCVNDCYFNEGLPRDKIQTVLLHNNFSKTNTKSGDWLSFQYNNNNNNRKYRGKNSKKNPNIKIHFGNVLLN